MARLMQGFVRFEKTALWLFFLMVVPAAFAQFNAGVQGSVQDSTGASIAGATITFTAMDLWTSGRTGRGRLRDGSSEAIEKV